MDFELTYVCRQQGLLPNSTIAFREDTGIGQKTHLDPLSLRDNRLAGFGNILTCPK
jgi:hypothetical protein